jgi:dTDP-4-dehydrorhamnose reductase
VKVLVLGGDGMLGHQLMQTLGEDHEVHCTLRQGPDAYAAWRWALPEERCFHGVDVRNTDRLLEVLGEFRPEALVNCVGVIKHRPDAQDTVLSLEVNSLLPHRLAALAKTMRARMVHFSTDCVFRGDAGPYAQDFPSDATDVYGRTKFLGEVGGPGAVTIRSSIIGLELKTKASLVEWFLAQTGTLRGFTECLYTGITTQAMARLVGRLLTDWREVDGVWQVASEPIDKDTLLRKFSQLLGRDDVEIVADDSVKVDRRLEGHAFVERTGYQVPSWDAMLAELAAQVREREAQE